MQKPEPKPTGLSSPIKIAHISVLMTMHNCSSRNLFIISQTLSVGTKEKGKEATVKCGTCEQSDTVLFDNRRGAHVTRNGSKSDQSTDTVRLPRCKCAKQRLIFST